MNGAIPRLDDLSTDGQKLTEFIEGALKLDKRNRLTTEQFYKLLNDGRLPPKWLKRDHLHLSQETQDALSGQLSGHLTPFAQQLSQLICGTSPGPLQIGSDADCVHEITLVSNTLFDRVTEDEYSTNFKE